MGINDTIRKKLLIYLDKNNQTKQSFAAQIGVVPSTITRFADGTFNANGKLLDKIAHGIGGKIIYTDE